MNADGQMVNIRIKWLLIDRPETAAAVPAGTPAIELLAGVLGNFRIDDVLVVYNGRPVLPQEPLTQAGVLAVVPVLEGG
ncbi:MAG: hypothetical protein N2491_13325 [Negativicutes bacterium]|nr:hypothetical protein [Negativicutes bacterium]